MLLYSVQDAECGAGQSTREIKDKVVLVVGDLRVKCAAFQHETTAVLVPLAEDSDLLARLPDLPVMAHVESEDGTACLLRIDRSEMRSCIFCTVDKERLNRRWSRRIKVDFRAAISVNEEDWCFVDGCDISHSGMLFAAPRDMHVQSGARIDFRIQLPHLSETVAGRGTVVRQTTLTRGSDEVNAYGVRFTNLRLSHRSRLSRFLSECAAESQH